MKVTKRIGIIIAFVAASAVVLISYTNLSATQDSMESRAQLIFKRLTGTGIAADSPDYQHVVDLLKQGQQKEAAHYITSLAKINADGTKPANYNPNFYNIVVRDMFARMSVREETQVTPLNDFTATGIGVVRDDLSAQELLRGNFIYAGKAGLTGVRSAVVADILGSNNHYQDLETKAIDLNDALVPQPQQVLDNNNAAVANPDPAGLITSRAFMAAHAIAGTNRRVVEFSFREFMCAPITEWASAARAETFIGPDVERFPNGKYENFNSTCRGCHAGMDSLRSVFGRVDFITANNLSFTANTAVRTTGVQLAATGSPIVSKYSRNATVYPAGYKVYDADKLTKFQNLSATTPGDGAALRFGWDPNKVSGSTVNQFGDMLASSKGFSKCMVRQVFQTVCRRVPIDAEQTLIENLANRFESNGYKLRDLFEDVVVLNECIGQ